MSADERVAAVLADHEPIRFSLISEHGPWHLTCSCEQWTCDCEDPMSVQDGACLNNAEHRAHVAAALGPVLDEVRTEAWDEGYDMGDPYQRRGNPDEGKHRNPYRGGTP